MFSLFQFRGVTLGPLLVKQVHFGRSKSVKAETAGVALKLTAPKKAVDQKTMKLTCDTCITIIGAYELVQGSALCAA